MKLHKSPLHIFLILNEAFQICQNLFCSTGPSGQQMYMKLIKTCNLRIHSRGLLPERQESANTNGRSYGALTLDPNINGTRQGRATLRLVNRMNIFLA